MPEQPCSFHPDRLTGVTCSRCERPICPDDMHPAPVGIHCPICAGKMREGALGEAGYRARMRAERNPTLRRLAGLSVSKALIGINLVVFLLMLATGAPTSPQTLFDFGALPPVLPADQWWRLFTAMFVHIGFFHLGFNLYALYLFGPSIEHRFGKLRFIALYLVAGLAGSAASLAFTEGGMRAGASGGVFGILGAWIAIFLQHRADPGARSQLTSLFFLVGINLVFGFTVRGIDNAAHVGGLIAGIVVGSAVEFAGRRRSRAWQVLGLGAFGVVVGIAVGLVLPNTV